MPINAYEVGGHGRKRLKKGLFQKVLFLTGTAKTQRFCRKTANRKASGRAPGRRPEGRPERPEKAPEEVRKTSGSKTGLRITKSSDSAQDCLIFQGEIGRNSSVFSILVKARFRAQARWCCAVLQNHRACAQSAKPLRLYINMSV